MHYNALISLKISELAYVPISLWKSLRYAQLQTAPRAYWQFFWIGSLGGLFAAPTPALPHGGGGLSFAGTITVEKSSAIAVTIQQLYLRLLPIYALPRGGGLGWGQQTSRTASSVAGFALQGGRDFRLICRTPGGFLHLSAATATPSLSPGRR